MTAKLKYYLGFCLLIFSACSPQAPQKTADLPEWIIPEDIMMAVLTDVHIIEGARIGKTVLGDSLWTIDHYDKLWEKYHISETLYDSSFRFYSRNPEKMDQLYEQVLTNLSTMSSELEGASDDDKEEAETDLKEEPKDSIVQISTDSTATDSIPIEIETTETVEPTEPVDKN
ncbi:MAG: hypothetical protein ACJAZH_000249 [Roseivirga sp.]